MPKLQLGIDFGSSNITMVRADKGIVLREAAVVAITGQKAVEFGNAAKKLVGKTKAGTDIIAPMQEGVLVNAEAGSLLLKAFVRRSWAEVAPSRIDAVFSVPLGSAPEERNALQAASYMAGISTVRFVPSSLAAALGADFNLESDKSVIIANLGGGITDIAVISGGMVVSGCSISVGGGLMDSMTAEMLANTKGLKVSTMSAERIKKDISSLYKNDISTSIASGTKISAAELNAAVQGFCLTVISAIKNVLAEVSDEILEECVKSGLILCGGSAKINGIEKFFGSRLGVPAVLAAEPELCVAIGLQKLLNNPTLLKKVIEEN
ncbi:MAG: rod shape-determining protein [Firmicutes bacterium]|nr:rod shape-determining protein [Bacillota bacterium]